MLEHLWPRRGPSARFGPLTGPMGLVALVLANSIGAAAITSLADATHWLWLVRA